MIRQRKLGSYSFFKKTTAFFRLPYRAWLI